MTSSFTRTNGSRTRPTRVTHNSIAWVWFVLSVIWAVVVVVTDQPAWLLAIWIAVSLGPITWLRTRRRPSTSAATTSPQGTDR